MNAMPFSHFDAAHWHQVKAARARLGINRPTQVGQELSQHPLAKSHLTSKLSGKTYQVERVFKDWLNGWFVAAIVSNSGSHRVCIVENLSSTSPDVLAGVEQHHFEFGVQH